MLGLLFRYWMRCKTTEIVNVCIWPINLKTSPIFSEERRPQLADLASHLIPCCPEPSRPDSMHMVHSHVPNEPPIGILRLSLHPVKNTYIPGGMWVFVSVLYCDMAQDQVTVIGRVLTLQRLLVSFTSASPR